MDFYDYYEKEIENGTKMITLCSIVTPAATGVASARVGFASAGVAARGLHVIYCIYDRVQEYFLRRVFKRQHALLTCPRF